MAAKSTLGTSSQKKVDWFEENAGMLVPMLEKRKEAYLKWLDTGNERERKKFAELRRKVRRAVRVAKNSWFLRKAQEAEHGMHRGKVVWSCIRDIQRGRRGLVPVRAVVVRNEEGNLCKTPEAQQQRWRRHFSEILNLQSGFSMEELELVRKRPVKDEMSEPPSEEELERAIGKLRSGKAGGETGVLPEMVKVVCHEEAFMSSLMSLCGDIWRKSEVPRDWCDAVLIPLPKKGDLSVCDNWRGISLLDVVGKVVARVIQECLQKLAEDQLPESQCGFRKGCGCTDMIFTVRQLVEKSWENTAKTFLTFIDLRKAYDSVPREALWIALQKLGVPEGMVNIIASFHNGMKAKIRLDGMMLEEFKVSNGLRQGCCMAPVLFNLFSCLMVERWLVRLEDVEGVGVDLHFKYDEKLFRRYTRNAQVRMLTECLFADDGALLATSRNVMERAVQEFKGVGTQFGLTLSVQKTKHMVVGRQVEDSERKPIVVEGGEIQCVKEFPYLGAVIADSGRMDADVESRLAKASKAYGALRKAVFLDRNLSLQTPHLPLTVATHWSRWV